MNCHRSHSQAVSKRRVLFVPESVTLAHVARTIVLAKALDPARYDVHLACAPGYLPLFGPLPFTVHEIFSMPTARFLDALTRLGPIWDQNTLSAYVEEELALIRQIDPELVFGDLRISLAVSTRVAQKPLATIVNAYWSPFARSRFSIPDVTLTKALGVGLANAVYRVTRPLAFALHARPLNLVCRKYHVPPIGSDLRRVFTYGDYTLYPDVPELVPTFALPDNHRYLGPVLWSPEIELPDWWENLPPDRPVVYVTFGSSGPSHLLEITLQALAGLDVTTVAATADRVQLRNVPRNAFVTEYLPGDQAARRARLVICNGGSPTTYQALAQGAPVLGLASNTDQLLNMDAVQRTGAGEQLRALTASSEGIRRAAKKLIGQTSYQETAAALARVFTRTDAPQNLRRFVETLLPPCPGNLPQS
jgi:UDP:flavonoid glycosyltransferase YjiC (YdhE family)